MWITGGLILTMGLPNLASGYELCGSIAHDVTLIKCSHRVGRFGEVSDLIVYAYLDLPIDANYIPGNNNEIAFVIDDELDKDLFLHLLSIRPGDRLTLCSSILQAGIMTYVPYIPELPAPVNKPKCCRCGQELSVFLDSIYCPNHYCCDRVETRLLYALSRTEVPIDAEQLLDISKYFSESTALENSFIELLVPCDFNIPNLGYVVYGNTLKYLIEYTKQVSVWLYNYNDVVEYRSKLANYILALSIPELTFKDICKIMDLAISEGDYVYVFLKIGAYIESKNPIKYKRYMQELADIETRLHYVHET